jgi:hypothetical protein
MVMLVAIPDPPHSPEPGDPLDTSTATAKLLTPVKPIQPESESQSRTPRVMVGSGFDHFRPVEAPVLAFAFRLGPRDELRPSERKTHGFESQGTGPTARQTLSEIPDRAEPSWERPAERERDASEIQQEHPPEVRSAYESEASHHPLEPVRRVSTPAAEPPPIPVVRPVAADHTPVVRDRVEEHPVVISAEEVPVTPAVERVEVVRSTVERGAVRELVLSVTDANARPEAEIELRFAERQGEIEVAVYGSDAEQSAQVKSELEQLTARLEGAGFGVETDSLSPERESTRGEMPGGERGRDGSMPFNFDDRGQRRGSRQLREMWLNRIWEEAT